MFIFIEDLGKKVFDQNGVWPGIASQNPANIILPFLNIQEFLPGNSIFTIRRFLAYFDRS